MITLIIDYYISFLRLLLPSKRLLLENSFHFMDFLLVSLLIRDSPAQIHIFKVQIRGIIICWSMILCRCKRAQLWSLRIVGLLLCLYLEVLLLLLLFVLRNIKIVAVKSEILIILLGKSGKMVFWVERWATGTELLVGVRSLKSGLLFCRLVRRTPGVVLNLNSLGLRLLVIGMLLELRRLRVWLRGIRLLLILKWRLVLHIGLRMPVLRNKRLALIKWIVALRRP